MEWVSQITTVVAEMVLPGLAGQWLDRRWGTDFLTLVGFALGLTVGIWHLIAMTRSKTRGSDKDSTGKDSNRNQSIGNDPPVNDQTVGKDPN